MKGLATGMALAADDEAEGPKPVATIPPARWSMMFSIADMPTMFPFSSAPMSFGGVVAGRRR